MGLSRSQRVEKDADVELSGLMLSPQDYFILSRVEGTPTIGEVVAASGLPSAEAESIVARLLEVGALREAAQAAPPPKKSPSHRRRGRDSDLRASAQERRRKLLVGQLTKGGTPQPRRVSESEPSQRETPPDEDDEEGFEDEPDEVAPVPAGDPRVDEVLPISTDDQRWLLALVDAGENLTPFQFLGIMPTHDQRRIRRAYHEMSRRMHPDAYYGRDIGPFRELLAGLFERARAAHDALQEEQTRNPYVDERIADEARVRRVVEQKQAAQQAVDELKRKQEEAEAAVRRQQRAERRARRQRERVKDRIRAEAERHLEMAQEAEKDGSLARAANLYRLALRADPDNEEIRQRWEEVRTEARQERAADAFARALRYLEIGQAQEATKLLVEAAEAHPTVEHLAYAADAVRLADKNRARDFAIAALDALGQPEEQIARRKKRQLAVIRVMIGRAFLAAGQKQTAQEQALAAKELRPEDPEVRALLKSIKVT